MMDSWQPVTPRSSKRQRMTTQFYSPTTDSSPSSSSPVTPTVLPKGPHTMSRRKSTEDVAVALLDLHATTPSPSVQDQNPYRMSFHTMQPLRKNLSDPSSRFFNALSPYPHNAPSPHSVRRAAAKANVEQFDRLCENVLREVCDEVERMARTCYDCLAAYCSTPHEVDCFVRFFFRDVFCSSLQVVPEVLSAQHIRDMGAQAFMAHAEDDLYSQQYCRLNWRIVFVVCRNFNAFLKMINVEVDSGLYSAIPDTLSRAFASTTEAVGGAMGDDEEEQGLSPAELLQRLHSLQLKECEVANEKGFEGGTADIMMGLGDHDGKEEEDDNTLSLTEDDNSANTTPTTSCPPSPTSS